MSTLVLNKHTPVDATGGVVPMALPTGAASGDEVSVEKYDASPNAVTISGSIRGVAAQSISLSLAKETITFRADSSGSWWPVSGHKTKSSLDGAYEGRESSKQSKFVNHRQDSRRVKIPAAVNTVLISGSAAAQVVNGFPVMSFPAGVGSKQAYHIPELPPDWTAVDVEILVSNAGTTNTGTTQWRADWSTQDEGLVGVAPTASLVVTTALDAQNVSVLRRISTNRLVTPNKAAVLYLVRLGNVDGYANAANVYEIRIRKSRQSVIAGYDGIWTFWHEQVTTLAGKTYFGGVDHNGGIFAASYDNTSGARVRQALDTITPSDDHNNPAVVITATKPPVAVWSDHGHDNLIRYAVGTTPGDITTLGAKQTVVMPNGFNTYAQVHPRETAGELYLFSRGGGTGFWSICRSLDWLTTPWSTPRKVVSFTGQGYVQSKLAQDGRTLRCMAFGHPSDTLSVQHAVWYFTVDLVSGDVKLANGTTIGNCWDGNTTAIFDTTVQAAAYTCPAGRSLNGIDVSDSTSGPEFLVAEYDKSNSATVNDVYLYGTLNSDGTINMKTVVGCGGSFGYWDGGLYVGAGSFPYAGSGGQMFLAWREESLWKIGLWTTTDGGNTWTVTVKDESPHALVRPFAIKNPNPYTVAYTELVRYSPTTYLDFYSWVMLR